MECGSVAGKINYKVTLEESGALSPLPRESGVMDRTSRYFFWKKKKKKEERRRESGKEGVKGEGRG